jgi:hypothetical protein
MSRTPQEVTDIDVVALLLRCFVYFHRDAMGIGPSVLADTRHRPGHLHIRLVGFDDEAAQGVVVE